MRETTPSGPGTVRFGVFEADLRSGELRRSGLKVKIQDQPFQILSVLLERPGELVTREELQAKLWPKDVFVDFDQGLNKAVKKLREALNDDADNPRFVETIPKKGYRFVAPVTPAEAVPAAAEEVRAPRRRPLGWNLALAIAVVAAGLVTWRITRGRPAASPSGKVLLVVLPFENLGGDSSTDADYFSDGLTEEMIAQLGRLDPQRLGVIARTSAMQYKGAKKRVDEIARELGVQYVLEGSVRRTGDRLRITAQLIQVSDQTHLWAENYERQMADVFAIQSEVALRIARSLALELLPARRAALSQPPTTNSAAHDAYLQGRYHWNKRTAESLHRSLAFFEDAVQRDPSYALGYAGIADAYNLLASYGALPPTTALPKAMAAAEKALALDDGLAEAHAALGWTRLVYNRDWDGAARALDRALQLNPGFPSAHQWRGYYLKALGRHEEALAEARLALELDPLSLIMNSIIGWHYYLARDYDRAITQCRKAIAMEPAFSRVYSYLGWSLLQKKQYGEAIAALEKARDLFGATPARQAELAHGYALAGRRDQARRILADLARAAQTRYVESDLVARVHVALGERDQAFSALDRALAEHAVGLVLLKVDPALDPLRDDPRFAGLLGKAGFR